ncbi:rod shape-determining protein MreB [Kribbella voronezhensis]|uniref:Rod shape-determining protein MreB n=1 Tax=Kribbella voronezhensis TaxID=2512212 RepID=A0A4V3FJV6_9ACTN|nr:rod shape-determining protein [Kribbella voronezhensis]TDU87853.1 rod shape-determining protein MreB [Kribbella voronezhensis]
MTIPRPPLLRKRGAWAAGRRTTGIAIDLGSARTRAWIPDRGLVFDVPTTTLSGGEVCHPVRRGTVVDPDAAASMLDHRLGRPAGFGRYSIAVVTIPVLCTDHHRSTALTALKVLDARTVLTIHSVKAAALGAGAGLDQPLLVVDVGAHLTEVGLLVDGGVTHGRRIEAGTSDLGATTTVAELVQSIVAMVTGLLRLDCGGQVVDALERGPLLTGGGALRPEITYRLAKRLVAPVRPAAAPQFAAVRGAGLALVAAGHHPSVPLEGLL